MDGNRISPTEYAAQSVGRNLEALTDLTTREAGEVYAAARAAQREAQAA